MIVIGYPGIGKSTLAYHYKKNVFDLDSSIWMFDGKREENWFVSYCKIAINLSKHGYIVMVSCHDDVQTQLKNTDETVIVCYPDKSLEEAWVAKLRYRYETSGSDKDLKALERVKSFYKLDIENLENTEFIKVPITDVNYDLYELLKEKGATIE